MVTLRGRFLLLALPFAGGAGLVLHIVLETSLPLGMVCLTAMAAALWVVALRVAPPEARAWLRGRVTMGLKAGLAAVVAYDIARFGVVSLLALSFEPFHVWEIFGRLFVGQGASSEAAFAAGAAYHVFNGLGFAVGFALVFRNPRWYYGVAWGLGLELMMATLYPAWLQIEALKEFYTVSLLGHLVYGAVLGLAMQRLLAREDKGTGGLEARAAR